MTEFYWEHPEIPEEVKSILSNYLHRECRLRFFLGDKETGQDWEGEWGTMGYVGRSGGTHKIPLIISNSRSMGGPALLTDCIIKITSGNRVLYEHKNYHHKNHEIVASDMPEYAEMVLTNGEISARFSNVGQAKKYVDFIEGKRNNKS